MDTNEVIRLQVLAKFVALDAANWEVTPHDILHRLEGVTLGEVYEALDQLAESGCVRQTDREDGDSHLFWELLNQPQ